MPVNLAKPTFFTGPSDKLAAVDVYTQTSNSVVNAGRDSLAGFNFSAPSVLGSTIGNLGKGVFGITDSLIGGAKSMLSALPLGGGVAGLVKGGVGEITERLGLTNPALLKAVKALTPLATQAIEKKLPVGKINTISMTLNGVSTTLSAASANNLSGVMSGLNSVAAAKGIPGFSYQDTQGALAVVNSLTTGGMQAGVPQILTTLKNSGVISGQGNINKAVDALLPAITKSGSIGGLKEVQALAGPYLNSNGQSILSEFSKQYPESAIPLSQSDYLKNYTEIKDTFGAIKPDWLSASRTTSSGTDNAIDLSCIVSSSSEFKKTMGMGAFSSENPDDVWMLFGMDGSLPDKTYTASEPEPVKETTYGPWVTVSTTPVSTPEERATTLYPAATAMPPSPPLSDARLVAVVAEQKKEETKITVRPPSRSVDELIKLREAYNVTLNKRIREATDQLDREASLAWQDGNFELQKKKLAESKAAFDRVMAEFEPIFLRIKEDLDAWNKWMAENTTIN